MENDYQPEPMMSESITELAKALCEVQKTKLFALTDKKNPFFNSKYADLSSVWSAIREPLTANGLSVVQTTETASKVANAEAKVNAMGVLFPSLGDDWKHLDVKDFKKRIDSVNRLFDEGIVIVTTLMHVSGEWIRGRLSLKPDDVTPQGFGSAITYGRRYALAAIVGISPEDDDAEKAMNREKKQSVRKPANPEAEAKQDKEIKSVDKVCETIGSMRVIERIQIKQSEWKSADHSDYNDEEVTRISKAFEARIAILSTGDKDKKITPEQAQHLYAVGSQCKPNAWTHDMIKAHIREKYGWDTSKDLTIVQFNEVLKFIAMTEAEEPHIVEELDDALNEEPTLSKDELIKTLTELGQIKNIDIGKKAEMKYRMTNLNDLDVDQLQYLLDVLKGD